MHLINEDYQKEIAIVESEKTAITMSTYVPDYIWLATGSKSKHQTEQNKILVATNWLNNKDEVLKLFVAKEDIKTIENIMTNCESIKIDIETWHIYKDTSTKPENYKELSEVKAEYFDKILPDLIREIETSLRFSYNLN